MSDDRKGFFSKIFDNIKQEMTVNPEMKVCTIIVINFRIPKMLFVIASRIPKMLFVIASNSNRDVFPYRNLFKSCR